jgi:phosphoglycerol transferase
MKWLATLGLLAVMAYALTVALQPRFRPDQIGPYVLIVLIVALGLGWRLFRRPNKAIWLVALAALILIPAVAVARGFGRVDMIAMMFHADFGMAGATIEGLETEFLQATLSALFLTLCFGLLAGLWAFGARICLVFAALLIAVNPGFRSVAWATVMPAVSSDLMARYSEPTLKAQPTTTPDLVVIYLEGTDRHFADEAVWGDLYAPMREFEAEGISFTQVGQIEGTGWSLAGMVATQCGVPVLPKALTYRNNFDKLDAFMPNVDCLGDVMRRNGYELTYVVGGDLAFGGIDAFYRSHGFSRLIGMHEQEAIYGPEVIEAAKGGWVLDDQLVYETARAEAQTLLQQEKPFLLVVETIGPHGRMGILSRRCNDGVSVTLSKDVNKVVSCLLEDTYSFVRDTQAAHAKARPGKELRIVILSDHLSHNPNRPEAAVAYQGANTAIFLGSGSAGRVVSKPGAMIDIYPTILDWLDLTVAPHAAGLGRSLLRDDPTIVEVHGIGLFDRMLISDVPLSQKVWSE